MAHKFVPESLLALMLPVALLLASCGGGGGTAAAPAAPGTTTAPAAFVAAAQTATVGTSGGSVNLTATDGTLYTFTVPAGALAKDTALSLTTVEPNDGQRFRVVAGPDGLVFQAGLPATLTIRLPAGRELPTTGGLIYNGTPVPSTRNADGSIALLLYQLNGSATPVAALARTAQTAQRRVQAANVAGSGLVCRNPSVNGGPQAGTASYDEIALARYVECVTGQMEDLIDANDFPGAIRLAMSLDDLLQRANVDMPNFLGAASSLMCRGRQRALDTLVSITITDLDDLKVIQAVAYWDMFAQKIGHVCPGQPDLNTAVQPKIDDALTLLDVDPDNITTADVGSSAYISARAMAERSLKLRHELVAIARALGRPVTSPIAQAQAAAAGNAPKARANAAVPGNGYIAEALADAQLQGRLEPAVLKNLLPSPWQRCRSANDFVPLMALVDLYGALDALKSAAQYCGTSLQVASRNASGSTLDQLAQPLGGVSAGVQRVSGSIQATDTGALSVIGPIQALRCPADPNGSSENLVLKMDGFVFQTLASSPYLNNLSDIDIGAALAAAHPGATSGLTQAVLTVERTGSTCVGFWGPAPSPLLSLTLNFPAAVSALMLAYQPEPDGFRPGTYVEGTPAIPLDCGEGGGVCINPELNKLGSNAALPFALAARGVVLNVTQIGPNVFAVDADVTKGQGQEVKVGLQFSSLVPGRLNVEKNESWQTYPVSAFGSECVQLRDNASSLILIPGTPAIVNLFVSAHTVVCTHFAHPEEMAGRGRMVTITFVPD